jgi:hypothetical protein
MEIKTMDELRDTVDMWVGLAVDKFHAASGVVIKSDVTGESVDEIMAAIADHDQARKQQVLEAINIKVERSSDDTDMKIIRERARIIGILEDVYGSKEKS